MRDLHVFLEFANGNGRLRKGFEASGLVCSVDIAEYGLGYNTPKIWLLRSGFWEEMRASTRSVEEVVVRGAGQAVRKAEAPQIASTRTTFMFSGKKDPSIQP